MLQKSPYEGNVQNQENSKDIQDQHVTAANSHLNMSKLYTHHRNTLDVWRHLVQQAVGSEALGFFQSPIHLGSQPVKPVASGSSPPSLVEVNVQGRICGGRRLV